MKKLNSIAIVMIGLMILSLGSIKANAQEKVIKEERIERKAPRPAHEGRDQIPGLTEDQKKQMKEIHLKTEKEVMPLNNQLDEKKAHLKTLTTSDNPDQNDINKTIDDMMILKGSILKKQVSSRQEVRKLLNDEQRLMFDKKLEKKKDIPQRPPMPPNRPTSPRGQEK